MERRYDGVLDASVAHPERRVRGALAQSRNIDAAEQRRLALFGPDASLPFDDTHAPLDDAGVPHGFASPDVDFLADVVITGTVRGAHADCSPEEVEALLGDDHVKVRAKRRLTLGYDLVEFFWQRHGHGDPWQGTHFTVQAHRFEEPPHVDELCAVLRERGFPVTELPPNGLGSRRFERADSRVGVVADERTGKVLAISAPRGPGTATGRGMWPEQSGKQALRHLLYASDEERRRWVSRRRPRDGTAADWWLTLSCLCEVQVRDRAGTRAEWARLLFWLIRCGEETGDLDRAETAERLARKATELRVRGLADEVAETLPTADDLVRGCLEAMPASPADVPTRDTVELARENIAAMRTSRLARNLLAAALPHLERVRDPALRTELTEWAGIARRLF